MAAITPEAATGSCSHCGKDIPTSNVQLHYAHCSRNLERCAVCGDMVPKKHADEHYYNNHAPVHCSLCSATVEREDLALHRDEECPRRIITCDSCQFPLPAVDLAKHQEVCGNRRVFCDICNSYVRLRELLRHQLEFHHSSNGASACSSSRTAGNAAEREGGGDRRRRQAPQTGHDAALRWRIIVPIAVTGVAIAIGSFFFQKRTDTQQQSQ